RHEHRKEEQREEDLPGPDAARHGRVEGPERDEAEGPEEEHDGEPGERPGERQVVQDRRDRDDDGLDQEDEGEVRGELAEEDRLAAPRIEEELLEGSVLELELIRPIEG